MKLTAMFSRVTRKPHRRRTLETRMLTDIYVKGGRKRWQNSDEHGKIREELRKHTPEGDGWSLSAYGLFPPSALARKLGDS